jgi:hypothetical protein
MTNPSLFVQALLSDRRASEIPAEDDIFEFLLGSWQMEAVLHDPHGGVRNTQGELHACRVLEGRAIQDLFIFPSRALRASGAPARGDRYATTIRTYDRPSRAWNVIFINPAAQETNARLVARRQGSDILMEGTLADSSPIRWGYTAVTPTSFRYRAERLQADTWSLYLELFGRR